MAEPVMAVSFGKGWRWSKRHGHARTARQGASQSRGHRPADAIEAAGQADSVVNVEKPEHRCRLRRVLTRFKRVLPAPGPGRQDAGQRSIRGTGPVRAAGRGATIRPPMFNKCSAAVENGAIRAIFVPSRRRGLAAR